MAAYGFAVHYSLIPVSLISLTFVYFFIRIVFLIKNRSKKYDMIQLARDICNHYLYGIMPEIQIEHSLDDLNDTIQKFSKIVEIKPSPHILYITVIFFIISTVSLLLSFYFLNLYPFLKAPFTSMFNVIFGIIFLLVGVTFLIVFFLRIFQCGRKFIMHFKRFCRRWGLRILMLCFDLLYIPNVSLIISHVNVKKISPCPKGEYLYRQPDNYGNTFSYLIEHETTCKPCNISLNRRCLSLCNGELKFRPVDDVSLDFFKDIVKCSGGFIIWGALFVVLGIPSLWFYVIHQNRRFAFNINVFGNEPSVKWLKIVNRMKTTGIFLFVNYKYSNSGWSVLYLLVKFLAMILSTFASRFVEYLSFSLSILYLVIFIGVVAIRPYLYLMNNVLDSILYFAQFLFSLNSTLAIFEIKVSPLVTSIFSVIILVVPIVSLVFLLFFKRKSCDFENDPTYPIKLSRKEENILEEKRQNERDRLRRAKMKKIGQFSSDYEEEEEDENDVFVLKEQDENKTQKKSKSEVNQSNTKTLNTNETKQNNNKNSQDEINQPLLEKENKEEEEIIDDENEQSSVDDFELEQFDDDENLCLIAEDEYQVMPGDLETVNQCIERNKKRKKSGVEPVDAEPSYTVNKRVLAKRMTSMYDLLDVVVDGFTIEFVTKVLNVAIVCGMGAFGWYLGMIYSNNTIEKQPVCHNI